MWKILCCRVFCLSGRAEGTKGRAATFASDQYVVIELPRNISESTPLYLNHVHTRDRLPAFIS